MAEPLVPEETAFKIPRESVADLRMNGHGVLHCRDHLQISSERRRLNEEERAQAAGVRFKA